MSGAILPDGDYLISLTGLADNTAIVFNAFGAGVVVLPENTERILGIACDHAIHGLELHWHPGRIKTLLWDYAHSGSSCMHPCDMPIQRPSSGRNIITGTGVTAEADGTYITLTLSVRVRNGNP